MSTPRRRRPMARTMSAIRCMSRCASRRSRRTPIRSSWCTAAPCRAPITPARPTAAKAGRNISSAKVMRSMWSTSPAGRGPAISPRLTGRCTMSNAATRCRASSPRKSSSCGRRRFCTPNGRAAASRTIRRRCSSQQFLNRDALLALLEKIGPAILLTHSQAGAFGWPVADARPDLVKAILAIEPNGPPFYQVEFKGAPDWFKQGTLALPYGITAVPLTYAPPIKDASELKMVQQDKAEAPDLVRCYAQAEPARQLPNLQKMPILVLTSEASYHAPYDHCTVKYLRQAGINLTFIRLADLGIRGNSHVMMLEKNNKEIAAVIAKWLGQAVPCAE